jgi:DNA-binding MarR family transcriptional regulator
MSDPPDSSTARISTLAAELRATIGKLSRRLRDQTHFNDLTWTQISVLYRLEQEGPATVTHLARAAGMRPQSMGANIAALEAAGFVTGRPDPSDGRQTILSITPACEDWIRAGRAARQDWLHNAIQGQLDAAEQEQLYRAIALLNRLGD